MERKFILTCESTVDLPYAYMQEREIPVLFYSYAVDGQTYMDDMGRNPEALPRFYAFLNEGKIPSTSQLNAYQYEEFLEQQLQKGDVLHIAFGSGMTSSVKNAVMAAEILREKYPDRRIVVIDSLCSSSGYGMLVDCAADMRDRGCTLEETEQWVNANRQNVHHQFFSTDLKYYRRSGRMSGPTAMIGAILNICPIMRLDDKGKIIAYGKVRGNYSGKCWVCHSNCRMEAEETKAALLKRFPHISGEVRICDIGTIIASHCGPGTVAVFFFGDRREPYGGNIKKA